MDNKRIQNIINYPSNLERVKQHGVFDKNKRTTLKNFGQVQESDLFSYPSKYSMSLSVFVDTQVIGSTSHLYTAYPTDLWHGDASNIEPLEGCFLGYQNDNPRINFASLLNLPEFTAQLYKDLSFPTLIDKSFFYFLHALPLNPPVPMLNLVTSAANEVFEKEGVYNPNPALLFKNNAGIYSIPDAYMWWLGGIDKYRDYDTNTFTQLPSVTFTYNNGGRSDVIFAIDPNQKDTKFFQISAAYGMQVNINKFKKPTKFNSSTTVGVILNNSSPTPVTENYSVDPLNGFGNYQDLFNLIHKSVYGLTLPPEQNLLMWNIDNKMRTFPTYSYPIGDNNEITLYATYNVNTYINDNKNNGQETRLKYVTDTTNVSSQQTFFDAYSSVWDFIYFHVTDDQPNALTYDEIKTKIITYYNSIQLTSLQILQMRNSFFGNTNTVENNLKQYANDNPIVEKYQLFQKNSILDVYIDLIALQVFEFIENVDPIKQMDLDFKSTHFIQNSSFTCVLYPSGGGVAGLQYIMEQYKNVNNNLSSYLRDKERSQDFLFNVINIILNSARFVWRRCPFVGDTTIPRKNGLSSVNPSGGGAVLSKLGSEFLYSNDPTVPRQNALYMLDSYRNDRKTAFNNSTQLKYNDAIDYIGSGVMDICRDKYDGMVNSSRAWDILKSILIVDKTNFSSLTIDDVTYNVEEQIEFLTKYNVLFTQQFQSGDNFITSNGIQKKQNICKVMNASLTQAQSNKIKYVVSQLMKGRTLLNVGSVFDYGSVTYQNQVIENKFSEAMVNDVLNIVDNGEFIKTCLFGKQVVAPAASANEDVDDLYLKYYMRGNITKNELLMAADNFFILIDVAPNKATIKIAKDFFMLYLAAGGSQGNGLTKLVETVRNWLTQSNRHIEACLTGINNYLEESTTEVKNTILEKNQTEQKSDYNIMKRQTYYNIKTLFDNWIRVKDGKTELVYTQDKIIDQNSIPPDSTAFFNRFKFVDRANRDIGQNMLINIEWLRTFYENNYGYNGVNVNISLYSFLSELAKQHGSLIHALPSFINFGAGEFGTEEGSKYAGDLFGTFDYVDITDSSPKFLFQFIGNTNTILNTESNKNVRSASKSYSLKSKKNNLASNFTSNLGDGVRQPTDLLEPDASGMAFIVDFGEQHQQIFSNLQIDQSEFQNTEEWYKAITSFTKNQAQTQGGNLFSLYTERSYTAQVDSLGNLMIQPLMFFELANIPMFYGTYWITNVKHSITPNDIKTTFKGVRQPMAVLPSRGDVLLELSQFNINSLLGKDTVSTTTTSNSGGGKSGGGRGSADTAGGGYAPVSAKLLTEQKREFVQDLYKYAMISEATDGISAVFTLAQAALESGWGKSAPGNMYFGIKADSKWTGEKQLLKTTEILKTNDVKFPEIISIEKLPSGKYKYVVRTWFRKYSSPAESFIDHGKFFSDNSGRYGVALTMKNDPYKFATAIAQAGYATATSYASTLHDMINQVTAILNT